MSETVSQKKNKEKNEIFNNISLQTAINKTKKREKINLRVKFVTSTSA